MIPTRVQGHLNRLNEQEIKEWTNALKKSVDHWKQLRKLNPAHRPYDEQCALCKRGHNEDYRDLCCTGFCPLGIYLGNSCDIGGRSIWEEAKGQWEVNKYVRKPNNERFHYGKIDRMINVLEKLYRIYNAAYLSHK